MNARFTLLIGLACAASMVACFDSDGDERGGSNDVIEAAKACSVSFFNGGERLLDSV